MILKDTVLFVVPRSSEAWVGSEAMWITIAGWASAAKKKYGHAYVLTTDKVSLPEEVYAFPLNKGKKQKETSQKLKFKFLIPNWLRVLLKDIVFWYSLNNQKSYNFHFPWKNENLIFVWEHHDIFEGIGKKLAKQANVPYIKYVHAPQVWEAKKWGVNRLIWGEILEKYSEKKSLLNAHIVLGVSKEVKNKLISIGLNPNKIIVSPMAVDIDYFRKNQNPKGSYFPKNEIVIGWIGSFRKFHGLETVVNAMASLKLKFNDLKLILIGDGQEREKIETLTNSLKIEKNVIFLGRKSFSEIPNLIAQFDIAIVSADASNSFHYSPLKLREYFASGKATIAPNAGEIPDNFINHKDILLYAPGNYLDLAEKIELLIINKELKKDLENSALKRAIHECNWDIELEKVCNHLKLEE